MTNLPEKVLLFQKDYTNGLQDRYFLWNQNGLIEVSADVVVCEESLLICHDYWLIAPSLFQARNRLPASLIDIDEFRITTSGRKEERKSRERQTIARSLATMGLADSTLRKYFEIFNRSSAFEAAVYEAVAANIQALWRRLSSVAEERGEAERYAQIERPVSSYLTRSMLQGIEIDTEALRQHKTQLNHQYYSALKNFSTSYGTPLELPHDDDIVDYLEERGYDFDGVDVDYVLRFVPMSDSFAKDLLGLRKLSNSRRVLTSIPNSQRAVFPIADVFGSMTSRIYLKDPSLQNLAKRHRNIIKPGAGKKLSYIDYDQYEVGVMAALSDDPTLLALYAENDLYVVLADQLFGDQSMRKAAKRLLLSYAYGMNLKALLDAAVGFGASRDTAKQLFRSFSRFEEWKRAIWEEFLREGRIATSFGNCLYRDLSGSLTPRERRTSVSQVVQGTASLIFKKALIQLSADPQLSLKLPMHDAALVEHALEYDTQQLAIIFGNAMTVHFGGKIAGKASLENFYPQ